MADTAKPVGAAASVAAFRAAAAAKMAKKGGGDGDASTASEALLKFYRKAAESGNPSAQLSLALRLMKGDASGNVDHAEVVDLLTQSALKGNVTAAHNLGCRYAVGDGIKRDRSKAAMWFRRAATNGVVASQYNFGKLMESGWNAPDGAKDERVAAAWYKRASMQGHALATCALGIMQAEGRGVQQDWKAAVANFRKAAGKGIAVAQHNLALCYERGWGLDGDDAAGNQGKAVEWHRKAAGQGYAPAATSLALAVGHGKGVEKADWGEAVALLRVAADAGHIPAMIHLASCLNKGRGLEALGGGGGGDASGSGGSGRSEAEAAASAAAGYLAKAAEGGSATGHYNLGACYASGNGVADRGGQSWSKAFEHYSVAADMGHVAASYSAGLCLASGKGCPLPVLSEGGEAQAQQDWPGAFARFLFAAEKGHAEAAGRAALCFAKGRGVDQSWERAVHWYKVAVNAGGVDDAEAMLRKCQKYYVKELAETHAKRDAADAMMKAATHAAEVKAAAEKAAAAEADRLAAALASATTADVAASKASSPTRPASAMTNYDYCDEGLDDETGTGGDIGPMWWHNGMYNGDMLEICDDVEYEGGMTSVYDDGSSSGGGGGGGDDDDLRGESSVNGIIIEENTEGIPEKDADAAADMVDDVSEAAVLRRSTVEKAAAATGGGGVGVGRNKNVKNLTVDVNVSEMSSDDMMTWYNSTYDFDPVSGTTTMVSSPTGSAAAAATAAGGAGAGGASSPSAAGPSRRQLSPKVQQLHEDMRNGAKREAEMRASLMAARRSTPRASVSTSTAAAATSGSGSGSGVGMSHVRRVLTLKPHQRDDLWAVLGEETPGDPAAVIENPEALRDARNRLRRLLLHTHPDKFGERDGEKAQAQAATAIVTRLMETLDGMLAAGA